jgi:hypothetical protein
MCPLALCMPRDPLRSHDAVRFRAQWRGFLRALSTARYPQLCNVETAIRYTQPMKSRVRPPNAAVLLP